MIGLITKQMIMLMEYMVMAMEHGLFQQAVSIIMVVL